MRYTKPANGKRKKRGKPALLTRKALAAALGVHPDTVAGWAAEEDLPVAERGRGGKPSRYDLEAVTVWLSARDDSTTSTGLDSKDCRARRDLAQAKLAEQLYKVRSGKLLDAEEVEKGWAAELAAARAKILTVPTTYAERIFRAATLEGVGGVERVLRAGMNEVLRELAGRRNDEAAA